MVGLNKAVQGNTRVYTLHIHISIYIRIYYCEQSKLSGPFNSTDFIYIYI